MAFHKTGNNVSNIKSSGDWEKAIGFINLMVPNKFGMLPLLASNANQKALFEGLMVDTSGKLLAGVLANLAVDFHPNGSQNLWDFVEDTAAEQQVDPTKALGYINFYLPDEDGEMVQLGKVALWAKEVREQRLFDILNESPERCEKTLKAFLGKLTLTFYPAKSAAAPAKKSGFAILKAA